MYRPPYGPPASQGDGRSMLNPYGLPRTYPCQAVVWQDNSARATARSSQGWDRPLTMMDCS